MKSGFYQMEIEEESKHITAFITPDGHYEFNRIPFGYVNAPSIYQRAIDKALGDLKGSKAFVYLDDVLVPSTTIEEGLDTLQEVLCALSAGGVVLSEGTIKPGPRKVKALTETPVPLNIKSVRQFMGLAGYFRRFIQGFSQITAPIAALLRKDQVFNWTPECESARQLIISKLTEPPILRIYNPELPCQLHTDASSVRIGAALLQVENGAAYPVAYYSRRTTDYESRYPAYDLETLAIVEAVEHFRVYLYGVQFTVFTDCNSVRATALKKNLHRRVAHWWMKLQDFDFSIEYLPGKQMTHVDYLSRNPVDEESDLKVCVLKTISANKISDVQTLREFQNNDSFCREILNDPDLLCTYCCSFIDDEIVSRLFSTHWLGQMHTENERRFILAKDGTVSKKYIKNCRSCVLGKSHTGPRSGLWQHGEQPSDILETWHIDHAGPMIKSNGCTQILVIIDAFSKYCRLQPIRKKTSEDSICALLAVFEELGRPKRIIADRGTAFTSTMFQNFLSEQGVKLHHIATGVPSGNGKVERLMRTVFNLLRATLTAEKENTCTVAIAAIEHNLNSTVHSATGYVPAVLQLGINPRLVATQQFLGDKRSFRRP
ncbi:Retrovirus-related Pol polyprotein from transposon 17.6-like Protein [Tribolium castaneum]|uniref:Retrovirus-related Pol polyprotein from transposon 17.6-like Protein n=1 Tax=Tribolium castaneum TaxID=7070 RepID=A0A139W8S4_TRICA|nr:Retrovirus-related Pol polyprotein from transposon 17.6-like Protein [Tribolium castaneum]